MSFLPTLALAGITSVLSIGANTALVANPTLIPGGDKVGINAGELLPKALTWSHERLGLTWDQSLYTLFAQRDAKGNIIDQTGYDEQKSNNKQRSERLAVNTGDALHIGASLGKVALGGTIATLATLPLLAISPWLAPAVALAGFAGSTFMAKDALVANIAYKLKRDAANGSASNSVFYSALVEANEKSGGEAFNLQEIPSIPVKDIEPEVREFIANKKPVIKEAISNAKDSISSMPIASLLLGPAADLANGFVEAVA